VRSLRHGRRLTASEVSSSLEAWQYLRSHCCHDRRRILAAACGVTGASHAMQPLVPTQLLSINVAQACKRLRQWHETQSTRDLHEAAERMSVKGAARTVVVTVADNAAQRVRDRGEAGVQGAGNKLTGNMRVPRSSRPPSSRGRIGHGPSTGLSLSTPQPCRGQRGVDDCRCSLPAPAPSPSPVSRPYSNFI
jgi:hypothetical protein